MGKARRGRPVGRPATANKNKLEVDLASANETFVVNRKSPSPEIPLPTSLPQIPPPISPLCSPEKQGSDSGMNDLEQPEFEGEESSEKEDESDSHGGSEEEEEEEEIVVVKKKNVKETAASKAKAKKQLLDLESDESEIFEDDVFLSEIDKRKETNKQEASNAESKAAKTSLAKVMKAKGRDKKVKPVAEKPIVKSATGKKKELLLEVILEGLAKMDERKGVSMPNLRKFVMQDDVALNKTWDKLRSKVRDAIEMGLDEELIIRPKGSEGSTGLTGSFKLNKKKYSAKVVAKEKSSKTSATTEKSKATAKETKAQTKKPAPTSPIAKITKQSKTSKKSTTELVKETEIKTRNKPGPKSKHRRSMSGDEVIIVKKKRGPKGMTRSQSLDQLAPLAAPALKKSRTKK